jgi:hypothetical protein
VPFFHGQPFNPILKGEMKIAWLKSINNIMNEISNKRANRVRRETWWSTAGVKPARELVRSTR